MPERSICWWRDFWRGVLRQRQRDRSAYARCIRGALAKIVSVCATQPLERHDVRNCPCCGECVTPHRNKRGRGDHQAAWVLLRYRGCNVSLAHANVVAEQRTIEPFQSGSQTGCRGYLVRLERDITDAYGRRRFGEYKAGNP